MLAFASVTRETGRRKTDNRWKKTGGGEANEGGVDEERLSRIRRRHPCQSGGRGARALHRSRLSAAACRTGAVPLRQPSGDGLHNYRCRRPSTTGASSARRRRARAFSGRESRWRGSKMPRPGVQDDPAANRVADMDDEGTDVHFLIPGSWMSLVGLPDPVLRSRDDPRLSPSHRGFLRPRFRTGSRPDRRLGARRRRGRPRNPRMGEVEMGGGGQADVASRPAARPSRPRPDLAGRRGSRPADRTPQLDLEPALLSRLTATSGTTSSSAAWRRIPGARCGLLRPLSAAASSTAIRRCAWGCSNAALAGCRSGPGASTSRRSMSAAPRP